jgi:hypothetical protein
MVSELSSPPRGKPIPYRDSVDNPLSVAIDVDSVETIEPSLRFKTACHECGVHYHGRWLPAIGKARGGAE